MSGATIPKQDGTASSSRTGIVPSLSVSYLIARVESRRSWRKVRNQDLWLAMAALGVLVVLVSLPLVFGFGRAFGSDLATAEASTSMVFSLVAMGWISMVAFGIMSGVGSEGDVDGQDTLLTVRPHKDVACGLLIAQVIGYSIFVVPPALVGGIGISLGLGTPLPLVGIVPAAVLLTVTGVAVGFATGLAVKGQFRRSPWLARLKPALGVTVVVGYFWLSATGRLAVILTHLGEWLTASPFGWLADLAFLTTQNAGASPLHAAGAVVLYGALIPIGVFAVVKAAEYAWYVDSVRPAGSDPETTADDSSSESTRSWSLVGWLDSTLGAVGVRPATRGVTTTVLVRGYRSPLQLVYIVVPLLFVLPSIETTIRTGFVPEWLPWVILLYGAWAAGAAFSLNILGQQGAMLPTLLSARLRGREVIHGYLLATALVFVPASATLGIATALAAERSTATLVAVGAAAPAAVVAGAVLAAGLGIAFPRFEGIDLTASTKALLPSKTAFGLFLVSISVAVAAVSVLADEIYAVIMSDLLSAYLPYGITVDPEPLQTIARVAIVTVAVATVLAYLFAVRRVDSYTLD